MATPEQLFRIIQSIPSKKAEPFKQWLARVGYERGQEIENPELAHSVVSGSNFLDKNPDDILIGGVEEK